MMRQDVVAIQEIEVVAFAASNGVHDIHVAVVGRVDIIAGKEEVFAFVEEEVLCGEAVCFEYRGDGFLDLCFFVDVNKVITGTDL